MAWFVLLGPLFGSPPKHGDVPLSSPQNDSLRFVVEARYSMRATGLENNEGPSEEADEGRAGVKEDRPGTAGRGRAAEGP